MIRIMVVEDDLLTRIGIASMIKGSNSGFEIIAETDNGKTALEIGLRERPDIILTDIKMPIMNGIELMRAAKDAGLQARFVILSSYNDFEYVREGVLLGAEDYLLKLELEQEKLISLLNRVSEKIEAERGEPYPARNATAVEERLRDEHAKACCIYNIVTGRLNGKTIIQKALDDCSLPLNENNLVCIMAQKEFNATSNPFDVYISTQTLKTLIGVVKTYGEAYGCIVDNNLFCLVATLRGPNDLPPADGFRDKIKNDLVSYMKNTLGIAFRICVSDRVDSYRGLSDFFFENCTFENNHYFLTDNQNSAATESMNYNFASELSLLDTVLHHSNIDAIAQSFDALTESIARNPMVSLKMLHSICYIVIHFTDHFFKDNPNISSIWSRSKALLQLNTLCRRPSDYIDHIVTLKNQLITDIQACKNYNAAIIRAKQFIEQNYARDLSLEEVATSINLAPAYFSRLFGHVTGTNFINYLTNIRIQRAKELLQSTNAKIKQIGEAVGYSNIYYFSRVFKNKTGITPVLYRKQNRIKN